MYYVEEINYILARFGASIFRVVYGGDSNCLSYEDNGRDNEGGR